MNKENDYLIVRDLSVGYSKEKIISSGINFRVSAGLTGIIGLNGSGKSTFLKTLAGIVHALSGEVCFNELSLFGSGRNQLMSKIFSVVLTEKISTPYFTVFDWVSAGRSQYTNFLGALQTEDKFKIEEAISACGITGLKDDFFNELSDGQKQKCRIARAIAQDTPVILLDEPTTYLDFKSRFEIISLLRNLSDEKNKIILFSSHDINLIFQCTDQCLLFGENSDTKMILKKDYDNSVEIAEMLNRFSFNSFSSFSTSQHINTNSSESAS